MKKCLVLAVAGLVLQCEVAFAAKVEELVAAMLGDTPVIADLEELTDTIGGRVTGSDANEAAVAWALERFRAAGVSARAKSFEMPRQLHEDIAALIERTGIEQPMREFGVWEHCATGERGRHD